MKAGRYGSESIANSDAKHRYRANFKSKPRKIMPRSEREHNGEVRVLKPADPEKLAEYRANREKYDGYKVIQLGKNKFGKVKVDDDKEKKKRIY